MKWVEKILERPFRDDRVMTVRDHLQCFLFWLTCIGPLAESVVRYVRRNLPPMFHTPMGFKYGNDERASIYGH